MIIKEVYERYKHLDDLLSDKTMLTGFQEQILCDLWQAVKEWIGEDCPVCHGAGATTDHHDPCTECGGSGKVGG